MDCGVRSACLRRSYLRPPRHRPEGTGAAGGAPDRRLLIRLGRPAVGRYAGRIVRLLLQRAVPVLPRSTHSGYLVDPARTSVTRADGFLFRDAADRTISRERTDCTHATRPLWALAGSRRRRPVFLLPLSAVAAWKRACRLHVRGNHHRSRSAALGHPNPDRPLAQPGRPAG